MSSRVSPSQVMAVDILPGSQIALLIRSASTSHLRTRRSGSSRSRLPIGSGIHAR